MIISFSNKRRKRIFPTLKQVPYQHVWLKYKSCPFFLEDLISRRDVKIPCVVSLHPLGNEGSEYWFNNVFEQVDSEERKRKLLERKILSICQTYSTASRFKSFKQGILSQGCQLTAAKYIIEHNDIFFSINSSRHSLYYC